jgi:3-oxoacyl-[acyl-carrier-protein] synthase-3
MNKNLKINGIGMAVPHKVYTNEDIQRITPNSKADWIEDKWGIKQRHVCTTENVVELGFQAAQQALTMADMLDHEIDLIIVNTSSSDKLSPSVSCMIQNKLNAKCPSFDINAVCSGFIYALDMAVPLLDKYKNILVVSTETYSKITDWKDTNSCFFGDGAAAVIISKSDITNFFSEIGADGIGWEHFNCDRNSTFQMNGKEVYKFGTRVLPTQIQKLLTDNKLSLDDIDWVIPHQPSHNVLKETARILGIAEDKVYFNMERYGNTAGASVPMALYDGIKNGSIQNGDRLILAAIGSGWTYGVAYLKLDLKKLKI